MENELLTHTFLFGLTDAAGIQRQEVGRRLGVSKTLISLWTQHKRSISWDQYLALLDISLAPDTLWKIARRFHTDGAIPNPGSGAQPELTPWGLVSKLITLQSYHEGRMQTIREAIATRTQELTRATSGAPEGWDITTLHRLSHDLATQVDDLDHSLMITPRVEKALYTLREALGDVYYREKEEEWHASPAPDVSM